MANNKSNAFIFAFIAGFGAFVVGLNLGGISGALSFIEQEFRLSSMMVGLVTSALMVGCLAGALLGGGMSDRYGRKPMLFVSALLLLVSALGCAFASSAAILIICRVTAGLGVGILSAVIPTYISEISPAHLRGTFVSFYQLFVVIGILVAYCANYGFSSQALNWRLMLGMPSAVALLSILSLLALPESPRWLVGQGDESAAKAVFQRTGEPEVEGQLTAIKESLKDAAEAGKEKLFQKKYSIPILIAFLIATFNQLSGINAILYYAPRLFELSGVFREGAMLQSIIVGLTNLTFTMLGMVLIDKLGRRTLLLIGAVGMVVSQALVAWGFATGHFQGYMLLLCICGYIAFFAISLGATIWVVIAEVFPNSVRAQGQAFGSATHWVWSALLTWFFPMFLSIGGQYIFGIFAVMAALSFVFALRLPETKNKSLEQIQKELVKK